LSQPGGALLAKAAAAFDANDVPGAERLVRERLQQAPDDVAALRLLAAIAARSGHDAPAEHLLRRALALAPGFVPARQDLARLLYRRDRYAEALAEFDRLIATDPAHVGARNLKASILDRTGEHDAAIALYRALLAEDPGRARVWMTLGHVFKALGRIDEAVDAYRQSLVAAPALGESWWGLANLKSFRFTAADVAAIEALLAGDAPSPDDRLHLGFALGKAREDGGDDAAAFAAYAAANRLRRAAVPHDPAILPDLIARSAAAFTPDVIARHAQAGDPAPDPIFVVGLPRSGSTLVEQILASHPAVEATMELPDLPRLAGTIRDYPAAMATLADRDLRALGARYLASTRIQRKTNRPFFVDKLPANFMFVGLIRLILPNAKIVDVRRHPLGCGVSLFRQHFATGHAFAYDLAEIGRHYADYGRLMALWDARFPGAVHRLIYEDLVADMDGEVRRLLDYLGLPFNPACLRFHETARAVRTPSAEQVRRPLNGDGLDQWRRYAPWLAPLEAALGDTLGHWRGEGNT